MSSLFLRNGSTPTVMAGLVLMSCAYARAEDPAASRPQAARGLEEVVVTVQRREEAVQRTPVSVAVLSADDLYQRGIKEVRDLTASVPGVNMSMSGAAYNSIFSIRGMSRGAVGNAQPAVVSYVNEVPLPFFGSSVPTYDIGSIQVLKGPQGTLFGRNTTAGAVLVSTKEPTYELEGYLLATVGSYNWSQYEGAVSVPLVKNKLALRIAGQAARRDGYTRNMSGGPDFDDMDRQNVRVSLLAEPFDGLSNLAVYEYNGTDETGNSIVFFEHTPGTIDAVPYYNGTVRTFVPFTPCLGSPDCDISVVDARQQAAGPRKAWTSLDPYLRGKVDSFSNTTTYELGAVTLKNIFGHRKTSFHSTTDIDGSNLQILDADNKVGNQQTTDEFQLSGYAFDDNLSYIAGLFYSDLKPGGSTAGMIQAFAITGTPPSAPSAFGGMSGNADYFYDKSRAVFAQGSYELSGISPALEAFSVDVGVRRTWDETRVCSVLLSAADAHVTPGECAAHAGSSEAQARFSRTTYTLGLNYKPAYNVLVYGVARTGYRAGGLNTPLFGGALVPFQSYKPETVQDFELGLKSEWAIGGMDGRFNLALYHSAYDDLQAGIPTTSSQDPDGDMNPANNPTSTNLYANIGSATVQGAEAELTLLPIRDLELTLSGSWIDKSVDKVTLTALGNVSPTAFSKDGIEKSAFYGAPDYSYTVALRYTLPLPSDLGKVAFSTHYFTMSAVDYNSVHAPRAEKLDVRLDWLGILQSSFDASLFATNVTDKAYPVAGSLSALGLGASSAMYNEPRMAGVQLRYTFGAK